MTHNWHLINARWCQNGAKGKPPRFDDLARTGAGLYDVHTHLTGPVDTGQGFAGLVTRNGAQDALIGVKHAAETLGAGFTSVRDIGTFRAFTDVALKEAIEA